MKHTWHILAGLLLLTTSAAQAQFNYITNNGTVTITGYTGSGGAVVIPATINSLPVTSIGDDAFEEAALTSVTIPDSVTSIGDGAFEVCFNLTSVTMGDSVASIGYGAFEECYYLPNVVIGSGVTNIGDYAFNDCKSLTNIAVAAQNPDYSSLNGVLFDKNQTTLIQYPEASVNTNYTVPDGVTNIGNYAFEYCQFLTSVTIRNSVTTIGDGAFEECLGLTNVTISNSVTSIGDDAFEVCANLTDMTIGSSVTNIGNYAFYWCLSLTNATIGNSVTTIGDGAFFDDVSLTTVFFKGNAPAVGASAFYKQFFSPFVPLGSTAYYLPGTTGWDAFSANAGLSTVLWNPVIQTSDGSFGVRNNQFGFNITATNDVPVEVEVSTNLANPVWTPLQTVTLTNGSVHFSESLQTSIPDRFYRLDFP